MLTTYKEGGDTKLGLREGLQSYVQLFPILLFESLSFSFIGCFNHGYVIAGVPSFFDFSDFSFFRLGVSEMRIWIFQVRSRFRVGWLAGLPAEGGWEACGLIGWGWKLL